MFELKTEEWGTVKVCFTHNREQSEFVDIGTACGIFWGIDEVGVMSNKSVVAWSTLVAPDQFDKDRGRKISLTRALKKWGVKRSVRSIIWKEYFNTQKSGRMLKRLNNAEKIINSVRKDKDAVNAQN